jgi:HEAT repeat protein
LTPNALQSHWITYEWAYALFHDKAIFPLIFESLDINQLHEKLRKFQGPDFTSEEQQKLIKRLHELSSVVIGAMRLPSNAPQPVKNAVKALDSHNSSERKSAVESLAQMDSPLALEMLVSATQYPIKDVRVEAALNLSLRDDVDDLRVCSALVEVFSNASIKGRVRILKVIATNKYADALPTVLRALHDNVPAVQKMAIETVKEFGVVAGDQLREVLQTSESELVRASAAWSLGAAKYNAAVPELINALNDSSARVRAHAASALGEIGDERAFTELQKLVNDKSSFSSLSGVPFADTVSEMASKALEKIQNS